MSWFAWFGRGAERERAYARLNAVKEAYGQHGARVIKLSARTDLARKSAGSTQKAFDYVERTFVEATQEYARIQDLIDAMEAGLLKGKVGDFPAIEAAVKGLGPKLDELERNLSNWEATWQQVPIRLEEARQALAGLRRQVEAAEAGLGAPLPLSPRLASMEQHLARTAETIAGGNPVEANHLLDDLHIAMEKLEDEIGLYASGVGAIAQAEQDAAALRDRIASRPDGGPAEALAAVAAAEALLPRLKPSLSAGKLEHFQQDLLQVQRNLAAARAALK